MSALGPSQLDHLSYGLRSLLEMIELDACNFYQATAIFEGMKSVIEANQEDKNELVPDGYKTYLSVHARILANYLGVLNVKITLRAHEELEVELMRGDLTWGKLWNALEFLSKVLTNELGELKVLVIDAKKIKYFEPKTALFGKPFEERFISSAFELDEAAKCLALGRPTASVFHLMRMMEIAVRAVARCLGISDPIQPADRNWGAVLRKVREGIDLKWPTVAARSSGDGELFDALYASLDAVKNPWRNPHPANKYTDDEAEHIFMAVRGFMTKLASRCDESGEPKA